MWIRIDPFQMIFMNMYARDGSLTNLVKQEEEERKDMTLYMFSEWIGAMLEWIFTPLQATMQKLWLR